MISNRMQGKNEKFFKCSCQLFIQNFKMSHSSFLYFVWSSEDKQTQSLKYQSIPSDTVEVGQTLSLNLNLCLKNAKFLPKQTNLCLLNDQLQQLDDIELNVNQWSHTFKEMSIPIGGGVIHVKVRRKQLMEVSTIEGQLENQMQEIDHYSSRWTKRQQHKILKNSERTSFATGRKQKIPAINLKQGHKVSAPTTNQQLAEQLALTKKQLEDNIYLNNKLKNDRDVLIKKQQSLQMEIQNILLTTSQQIKTLRQHYDARMGLRDTIYEEEIEEMILMLNGNADHTKKLIENLLKNTIKLEDDNKSLTQKLNHAQLQLTQSSLSIQKLSQQLSKALQQHQLSIENQKKKGDQDLISLKKQMEMVIKQIKHEKQAFQNQLLNYKAHSQQLKRENNTMQIQLKGLKGTNEQLSIQFQRKIQELQKSTNTTKSLSQMLLQQERLITQLRAQIESMKNQKSHSSQQLSDLNREIQHRNQIIAQLQGQLEEITYELEFNEDAHKQLQTQHQEKQQELYSQLENIESIYNQKIQVYKAEANQNIQQLTSQNSDLKEKIYLLENQKGQIQAKMLQTKQILQQLSKGMSKQQQKAKIEEINQLNLKINKLQNQFTKATREKQESHRKIVELQAQIQNLKSNNNYSSLKKNSSLKSSPQLQNRSVQFSRLSSGVQPSPQEILQINANMDELERQIQRKNQQIYNLNLRVQELINFCDSLQDKLKQANHTLNEYHQKHQVQALNQSLQQFNEVNLGIHPKRSQLKSKESPGKMNSQLQNSSSSMIKVSPHKVKQLEDMITQYQKRESDYQAQINSGKKKIQGLNKQIETMKKETENLRKDQENKKISELKESMMIQVQGLKKTVQNQREQLESKIKTIREMKDELDILKLEYENLKMVRSQLQLEIKQLIRTLNQSKDLNLELESRLRETQRKLWETQKKADLFQESHRKSNSELQSINKTVATLEQKLREDKEHEQQLRMQNRQLMFLNEQATNQMKKYKVVSEQLENKLKKYVGTESTIKELQKEVEENNKKNLEQLRIYNHLKLQKDSTDEEIKLLKKRHSEQTRLSIEWEEKALGLQRTIDQFKRKQANLKRQIQEAQQQSRKMRNQSKKLEEEIHTLHTLSTSFSYEKKKLTDELAQKADEVTRKEYENNRLLKQMEKYRHKIQESEDNRLGRKNQLRYEIEKLQAELIKKDKRILELEEELKMLKTRLEFLQKENNKIMQKKTQTYGDKLKHYVDEISSIKKLLDEYQSENSKLKIQANELFQENEMIKLSYNKLEKKYEESIDNEENILTDLQHYIDEYNSASEKNRVYHMQVERLELSYSQTKKQLDEEKNQNKRKSQKLQYAEKTNSSLMDEVKELKIKLSQLETETKIHYNINQKYKTLDRKKTEIEEDLKKVKNQYESYKSLYIYKEEQVQRLCQQLKNSERKLKQQELNTQIEQLSRTHNLRTNKFESQILQMFNENSKLREDIHLKSQQITKLKLNLQEFQNTAQKLISAQSQINQLNSELIYQEEELKRKNQKINKDLLYIQELQTKINFKVVELSDSITRNNELQMKIQKLNSKIQLLQETEQGLHDKIRQMLQKQKEFNQLNSPEVLNNEINSQQKRVFELELQLTKSKQKENSLAIEYTNKMKSLESKLEEMSQTMIQHQQQLQKHYEDELYKSEDALLKLSEQLEDKLIRIEQLNEALIILQAENQDLSKQLDSVKEKLDQETEIYHMEYNNLKNKLKDTDEVYNKNLKSLEEELTQMGRELAQAKFSRNSENGNQDKMYASGTDESKKVIKRFEEKLKTKDKKIEELKSNIYILEQTVLKLRKKQSTSDTLIIELENIKSYFSKIQVESQQKQKKLEALIKSTEDSMRQLKQQLIASKQREEQTKICLQQKLLQTASIQAELRTTRQLYSELQKQIQRRKINFNAQIQEESINVIQLRNKESIIEDQRRSIEQLTMNMSTLTSQNKKTLNQLKQISAQLKQEKAKVQLSNNKIQQHQNNNLVTKGEIQCLRQRNLKLQNELKAAKTQLNKVKKFYEDTKSQMNKLNQQFKTISKGYETTNTKLKESEQIIIRFKRFQEISIRELGLNLQQLLEEGQFMQALEQKQNQINQLIQEVEQLRFMSDRKLLDYDQLKKENYELSLKAEDSEILTEQVENLRKICDKLQEQKKQAVFRQQLIKMHLGNLIQSTSYDENYKRKIQNILRNVGSINGLGLVSFGESSFGNY